MRVTHTVWVRMHYPPRADDHRLESEALLVQDSVLAGLSWLINDPLAWNVSYMADPLPRVHNFPERSWVVAVQLPAAFRAVLSDDISQRVASEILSLLQGSLGLGEFYVITLDASLECMVASSTS